MTEVPNPGPGQSPIIEEPPSSPEHVPELPPMRDTPPQKEEARRKP
jgi:hypothetical protein